MAVSHIKSNAVPDFTGTVTVFNSQGSTVTVEATALVRPSDWNQAHNQIVTLAGNTAGVSSVSGTNIVLAGGNNVTVSAAQGVNQATVSFSASAQSVQPGLQSMSAGTTRVTTGEVVLSNSNGVSFGVNGNTVTASVRTNYAGSGFTSTTTGGILVVGTNNSDGLSLGVPNFITTWTVPTVTNSSLSLSDAATSMTIGRLAFTNINGVTLSLSTTTGGSATVVGSHNALTSQSNQAFSAQGGSSAFQTLNFANSNGITFSNSNGSVVASHNGLTTARASNDAIGLNTAQSNVTWTVNSAGVSFDARGYAGTVTGATNASLTVNSNGVSVSVTQSNQAVSAANGSYAFQTLSFSNANGISFGTSAGSAITASHNALTTARASNDAIGLNTAQSNVTWTVNSNGLSFDARGYVGTGTTFAGANVSGSITANSVGVNLSLSAGAGGGGETRLTAYAVSNTTQSSSGTIPLSQLSFAGAGIASVGVSNGSVIVSVPAGGGAGDGFNILAAGSQTANTNVTVVFSNSNNVTFGMSNSSVITASMDRTRNGYNPYADIPLVAGQLGQATLQFEPELLPSIHLDRLILPITNSNASNSSGSHTLSFWCGLYTRNASSISLLHSTSATTALTHSGTVGSYSLFSGVRLLTIPWTTTISDGEYWIGALSRTTTGGANGTYGNLLASNVNSNFVGIFGASHNTTMQLTLGQGVYSTTTAGLPASVAFTQIRGSDSGALRAAVVMFASGTV